MPEPPASNPDIFWPESLSGAAICVALFYSWLFTVSFGNRVYIYLNRDSYRPDKFVVTDAEFDSSGDDGPSWWLNGIVSRRIERLVPHFSDGPSPKSTGDLLARYPKGTEIEVLYNPEATSTIVQDESLRVLIAAPDFWEEELRLLWRLGLRVFLPVPLTLALYLAARYRNPARSKRGAAEVRAKMPSKQNASA